MKIINYISISTLFCVLVLVFSCTENKVDKSTILNGIAKAEKHLYGDKSAVNFDSKVAEELTKQYDSFTKAFPTDSLTPVYMFKGAEVLRSLRKFNEAAGIYKNIGKKYPNYEKAPHSLFLLGFSYENDLDNLPEAKKCYNEFLGKYPNHELADDVTFSLKNLGKSPDEIIKAFEANRKKK